MRDALDALAHAAQPARAACRRRRRLLRLVDAKEAAVPLALRVAQPREPRGDALAAAAELLRRARRLGAPLPQLRVLLAAVLLVRARLLTVPTRYDS